ncbi:aminotransferase class IV [Cribrihabitans sp. XS_ASV171]
MEAIQNTLIDENKINEGVVYLQVTGGTAERSFLPGSRSPATLIGFCQEMAISSKETLAIGISVATLADERWANRHLKTTMLLPQVQAKAAARMRGCDEAWLIEKGFVTEGASSTAFIVEHDGTVITRELSKSLLPGCTRQAIFSVCEALNTKLVLKPFTPEQALRAREAFITSASNPVTPVVSIDGKPVHDGQAGPVTLRIQQEYLDLAKAQLAKSA